MTSLKSRTSLRGALPTIAGTLLIATLGVSSAACVRLTAPERPIEINLNVAIRQEVLVRMQRDVDTLINQNPEAFPQRPATTPGTTGQQ